jgi:hypothetical protein
MITSEKLVLGTIFKRIYAVLRTFDVFDLVLIARISPNSNHHLKAMVLLYHISLLSASPLGSIFPFVLGSKVEAFVSFLKADQKARTSNF